MSPLLSYSCFLADWITASLLFSKHLGYSGLVCRWFCLREIFAHTFPGLGNGSEFFSFHKRKLSKKFCCSPVFYMAVIALYVISSFALKLINLCTCCLHCRQKDNPVGYFSSSPTQKIRFLQLNTILLYIVRTSSLVSTSTVFSHIFSILSNSLRNKLTSTTSHH